jgi:hypothetical protein
VDHVWVTGEVLIGIPIALPIGASMGFMTRIQWHRVKIKLQNVVL